MAHGFRYNSLIRSNTAVSELRARSRLHGSMAEFSRAHEKPRRMPAGAVALQRRQQRRNDQGRMFFWKRIIMKKLSWFAIV